MRFPNASVNFQDSYEEKRRMRGTGGGGVCMCVCVYVCVCGGGGSQLINGTFRKGDVRGLQPCKRIILNKEL